LIEETFEVAEAIEHEHDDALCEELGDLLLQIVFHSQVATERGKFSIADVIDALSNKMVRRHPHVFGDQAVSGVAEVWKNWEQIKAVEGASLGRTSRLDGIPKALGALQRAQKMQEKASRVGFDWPHAHAVTHKLSEEISELTEAQHSGDQDRIREEFGDVLFTLVNVARQLGFDAEGALREANDKFYRRFAFMEQRASAEGRQLNDMSIDELEDLWQLAKTAA
jgi:tetrapyrrole methylase family protein/MazG family protein